MRTKNLPRYMALGALATLATAAISLQGGGGGGDEETGQVQGDKPGWATVAPRVSFNRVAAPSAKAPMSDPSNSGGWKPLSQYTDEFNGDDLDSSKWLDHYPTYKGKIPGYFDPANVSVSGGQLHLAVKIAPPPAELKLNPRIRTIGTGVAMSKEPTLYGYYEVRARPSRSKACSGFWFRNEEPDESTEIDVFEVSGNNPKWKNRYHMSAHVFRSPNTTGHLKFPGIVNLGQNIADDFHVYGLEWDKDSLKYYIDGKLVRRGKNDHWHQPLFLLLTSSVIEPWFGLPEESELPATYDVDYVRAWQK